MIDSAWPETKPWNISATCWIAPGFSTFSEMRTSTKNINSRQEHQDLHGEGLGDGSLCIVGLDMHGVQNARRQVTKVAVQQGRERICFVHTVVLSSPISCGPDAKQSNCFDEQGYHRESQTDQQRGNLAVQTPQANIKDRGGGGEAGKKPEQHRTQGARRARLRHSGEQERRS